MSCVSATLAGIAQDCSTSKGGVAKVWIATEDPKPKVTDGKITQFEGGSVKFYAYNFKKNVSSMTSTLNIDPANGTNYVSTELILQFNKMETVKRMEMAGLAVNDMYAIVKDSNGKYWFLGYDEPVQATAGSGQTGTNKTDGNFYQISLSDESDSFPMEVDESIIPEDD